MRAKRLGNSYSENPQHKTTKNPRRDRSLWGSYLYSVFGSSPWRSTASFSLDSVWIMFPANKVSFICKYCVLSLGFWLLAAKIILIIHIRKQKLSELNVEYRYKEGSVDVREWGSFPCCVAGDLMSWTLRHLLSTYMYVKPFGKPFGQNREYTGAIY